MIGSLYYCAQAVSHRWNYGYFNTLEIVATPENLKSAIREKGKSILDCKFIETDPYFTTSYSPLEYAVNCQDRQSAGELISFGADVEYSDRSFGTLVHFYIDCLSENTPPDIVLLRLLLDKISDVNKENGGPFHTPLQHAINHMSHYKTIHWDVIELLFQKKARIEVASEEESPFNILKSSQNHKLQPGPRMRSEEEEKNFLKNLSRYLELERKYYPKTQSGLTLQEFLSHTFHLKNDFSRPAISMSSNDFFSETFASFLQDLKNSILVRFSADEGAVIQGAKSLLQESVVKLNDDQLSKCITLCRQFLEYHLFFTQLVNEKADFKDCFEKWQLSAMIPSMIKLADREPAKIALKLCFKYGLLNEEQKKEVQELHLWDTEFGP